MEIHEYSPYVYANLPEFNTAKEMQKHCGAQIEALGAVIRNHRFQPAIGVVLLHKHFNLLEDEMLVRRINNNKMLVSPTSKARHRRCPYMWAFAKNRINSPYGLYPVEFMDLEEDMDWAEKISVRLVNSQEFLHDFFKALAACGLANYLGLGLIPKRAFTIGENETLMESDNIPCRQLLIEVVPLERLTTLESTQTLWVF